jgi:hypothetical protein
MKQIRVKIKDLKKILHKLLDGEKLGKFGKFISIFSTKANKIVAFLDSDKSGNAAKKNIDENFKDSNISVIQTNDMVEGIKNSAIEDLIPRGTYLNKFKDLYIEVPIDEIDHSIHICEAIYILLKKKHIDIDFDKQKINKGLIEELHSSADERIVEMSKKVIRRINEQFKL